jgi:hypothetical protein
MENPINRRNLKFSLDAYSKIILTVIAVCLILIVTNMYFGPEKLHALQTVQDVNIKSINGSSLWGSELPVNLKQIDGSSIRNRNIPVDIQSVNSRSMWGDQVPVDIKSINGISIFGPEMPVKVK